MTKKRILKSMQTNRYKYCFEIVTEDGEKYRFSVLPSFLKLFPVPEKESISTLLKNGELIKHLHNPSGPSIWLGDNKIYEYWYKGRLLPLQQLKRRMR